MVTLTHGSPGVAEAGLDAADRPAGRALPVQRGHPAWKPAREVYLWAAGVCAVAPDRLALVAAHGWDVRGASAPG